MEAGLGMATACAASQGNDLVHSKDGVVFSMGYDWLINEGEADITVTGVELVEPKGMTLIGAVVLPWPERPEDYEGVGSWPGFPPTLYAEGSDEREYWDRNSRPAVGSVIAPGTRVNLVQGLSSADSASMKGVRVTYTYRGRNFWAETTTKFNVKPKCSDDSG